MIKSRILPHLILLLLLLPSLLLFFKNPLYPSHDGLYHVERIRQFDQAIISGQFPPRFAPTLFDGIGYPLFVVNYQLPYYFADFFMQFRQDAVFAFKATMVSTYLLSAFFAYELFRYHGSKTASMVGAILFSYLPYRFANIFTRGALGESVALMFLPLLLLSLSMSGAKSRHSFLILAFATFGLVTSHTVVFLILSPFIFAYFLLFLKPDGKTMLRTVLGFALGISMSSFQLLPSIFEKSFMKFDQNLFGLFHAHFIPFDQLFRLPAGGGPIGTTLQVGLAGTLVIFLSFFMLVFSRKLKFLVLLVFVLAALFLTLPYSKVLWNTLPGLWYVLFPWRFLSVVVICVSILSVYVVDKTRFKNIAAFVLIALAIFTSRHYFLKPSLSAALPPTESATTSNEFDPKWTDDVAYLKLPDIFGQGDFKIQDVRAHGLGLSFEQSSQHPSYVVVRRLYFPGWKVLVDGDAVPVGNYHGLISFRVPEGTHTVVVKVGETKLRMVSNLITLLSMAVFAIFYLTLRKRSLFV